MQIAGVVLFVLPFAWTGLVAALWLIGRAGQQGLFLGMIGNGASEADGKETTERGLRQQRGMAHAARLLLRGWPVAIVCLAAGIVLLIMAS